MKSLRTSAIAVAALLAFAVVASAQVGKGILDFKGTDKRFVFQAVHMIKDGDFQRPWRDGEKHVSKLVFIGRELDAAKLQQGFDACRA